MTCSRSMAGSSTADTGSTGRPGTAVPLLGCVLQSCSSTAFDCPSPVLSLLLSLANCTPPAPPSSGAAWFYISGSGTRFWPGSLWASALRPDRPVPGPRGTAACWSGAPARGPARGRRPPWTASSRRAWTPRRPRRVWPGVHLRTPPHYSAADAAPHAEAAGLQQTSEAWRKERWRLLSVTHHLSEVVDLFVKWI